VFEADFSRTERRALLDTPSSEDLVTFAGRTIEWAREHDRDELVWHFAALSSIGHLGRTAGLAKVAGELARRRESRVDGVRIVVETRRASSGAGSRAPMAVWWADDEQVLGLDSTHRPLVDALVSSTSRAPIWLTAFDVEVAGLENARDPEPSLLAEEPVDVPVVVLPEVQEAITMRSRGMTLSSNGIHDSLGPSLLADARRMIVAGMASREAIAVAALRAGWWPQKIPALLAKL